MKGTWTSGAGIVLCCFAAAGAPSIPGIGIHRYGQFPSDYRPYTLSLDPQGRLFAGSDINDAEGVFLRAVPNVGGDAVVVSGDRIYDPDGVLFDATGAFSGVANSLLVASSELFALTGVIRAVRPDGSSFVVVGPLGTLNNNDAMAFDSQHNLFINVPGNHTIVKFDGHAPTPVITIPGGASGGVLAIDDADRLWISCTDGNVRRYGPDNALQATIPVGASEPGLGWSAGGVFAKGVYVTNRSSGALYRVTEADTLEQVGTGFPNVYALAFDVSGNLHCANYDNGEVFRSGCVCDLNADGVVDDSDFVIFVGAYNILDCADPSMPALCPADFNRDSLVDDADFVIFVGAYNELVCG